MIEKITSFLHTIAEELFPSSCCVCDAQLKEIEEIRYGICVLCCKGLVRLKEPLCEICGIPLSSEDGTCLSCRESASSLAGVSRLRSVFLYAGLGPEILHAYKGGGTKPLARLWADACIFILDQLWTADTTLVPVPSLPKNCRTRGFDQMHLLMKSLPECYQKRVNAKLLLRDPSSSQKTLNREERQTNLSGKIRFNTKYCLSGPVLLVDDICTTGATLSTCALVLRAAGAGNVSALTLFRD